MAVIHASPAKPDPALTLVLAGIGLMAIVAISTVLGMVPAIIAVGIPAVVAVGIYLIRHPTAMLSVMVVMELSNLTAVVAQRVSLPIYPASLGLGLLTVGLALREPAMRARINRGTLLCVGLIGCYLITQLLAALGSQNPEASREALQDSIVSYLFLVVILLLVQLTDRPWTAAAAIVLPLAVISALCIISQVGFGSNMSFGGFANVTKASGELITTPRFAGPLEDSNFWGRHLAMALPIAGALIVRAFGLRRQRTALAWVSIMLVLFVGVYLTQSRGTLIATAIALVVWVLASGRTARRRGLMSLPLVALIAFVPGIGNRMVALATDMSDRGNAVDPSVLGRINAQEMAWAMFRDRPGFGFGPAVFETEVPRYAGVVETAVLHPATAPHNLYAQIAADSGVVGIAGWTVFVGGYIIYLATRVVRLSSETANVEKSLGAAVLAGLIAWSFASVFLHLAYFRTFAIMLGLAGALASTMGSNHAYGMPEARRDGRHVLLAAVFGVTAAIAVLFVSASITHTARQIVTLQPTMKSGGDAAYALDLKTRETLLPTYAAMMTTDTRAFTAVSDSVRGVITISVVDIDADSARRDLKNALVESRRQLSDFGANSWYTVAPVGSPTVHSGPKRSATASLTVVAAGVLIAAGSVHSFRRHAVRQQGRGRAGCMSRSRAGVPG